MDDTTSTADSTARQRSTSVGKNEEKGSGSEPPPGPSAPNNASSSTSGNFECNICLEQAHDAVVSRCGHLFCWPCLHRWLEVQKSRPVCPVCKAAISRDSVIPLYGRGADHKQDPRTKIPPRPQGVRTEPQPQHESPFRAFSNLFGGDGTTSGGGGGNVQFSVGFGAFPFGLFATSFNFGGGDAGVNLAGGGGQNNNHRNEAEALSKFFLGIAIFFIIWFLIC